MNYAQKNKLLFVSGGLILLAIVFTLILPVIELNNNCSKLNARIHMALQASRNAVELKKKINEVDKLLLSRGDTSIMSQQQVLEAISRFCNTNGTLLKEFPSTILSKNGEYLLETHVFTIEGAYPQLLNLAYELEHQKKIGRIASLYFKTKTDMRTQRKSLIATVYLQTIKKST